MCDETAPEMAMRPKFLATFGTATEQASKLGLSNNRNIISVYGSYQVGTCFKNLVKGTSIGKARKGERAWGRLDP